MTQEEEPQQQPQKTPKATTAAPSEKSKIKTLRSYFTPLSKSSIEKKVAAGLKNSPSSERSVSDKENKPAEEQLFENSPSGKFAFENVTQFPTQKSPLENEAEFVGESVENQEEIEMGGDDQIETAEESVESMPISSNNKLSTPSKKRDSLFKNNSKRKFVDCVEVCGNAATPVKIEDDEATPKSQKRVKSGLNYRVLLEILLREAVKAKEKKGAKVSIKNGRIYFSETKLSFDLNTDTIQELACFHEYLRGLTEYPDTFPMEHYPLLAKLIQESDQNLGNLLKKINQFLFSGVTNSNLNFSLFIPQVENAINSIACLKNYGLLDTSNGSISRWEVNNLEMISEMYRTVILQRRERRLEVKEELKHIYNELTQSEKDLFDNYSAGKKSHQVDEEAKRLKQLEKEKRDAELKAAKELKEREKEDAKKKKEEEKIAQQEAKERQKLLENEKLSKSQPKISGFFISKSKEVQPQIPLIIIKTQFEEDFPDFYCPPHTTIAPPPTPRLSEESDIIRDMKNLKNSLVRARPHGMVPLEVAKKFIGAVVKLLQFSENYRPAFYGTWKKRSRIVKGRKPFAQEKIFDYEFDSDEEWEDEEEGDECLTDEEDDDEEEMLAEEENEDGWLVPHGYLSDDEGLEEDEHSGERESTLNQQPKKIETITPVVYGLIYDEVPDIVTKFNWKIYGTLSSFDPRIQIVDGNSLSQQNTQKQPAPKKPFADELLPSLIEMVNLSSKGIEKIVEEFRQKFGDKISRHSIHAKIKEIAVKEKREGEKKPLWYIKDIKNHQDSV